VAAYAAPKSYQANAILTATPGRLLVMLYDGAGRFLKRASMAMEAKDVQLTNESLQRAEAIIDELLVTLNLEEGGEIAASLRDLYVFCRRHLNEARIERSTEKIDDVAKLLAEIRDAYSQIETTTAA
jgi:flagellar secretion chaperone FliS